MNNAIAEFQSALYRVLSQDALLSAKIGDAIFDANPQNGELPGLYLQIGDGRFEDRSTQTHRLENFYFDIHLYAKEQGFASLNSIGSHLRALLISQDWAGDDVRFLCFRSEKNMRLDGGRLKRKTLTFKASLNLSNEVETW